MFFVANEFIQLFIIGVTYKLLATELYKRRDSIVLRDSKCYLFENDSTYSDVTVSLLFLF